MSLPRRIGKYELLQFLGGRMAEVYRAIDRKLGRTVAFKILSDAGMAVPEAKARFLAEARLTGGLAHENVIAYYDYGEAGEHPFLVMEYVEGKTLRHAIRDRSIPDALDKLDIARQIAAALEYIHSKGIIHRDVKPDNVRIGAGQVKLGDFGIAKSEDLSLTGVGFTVGTPYYMAPEQIRGQKPAPPMDVYAFGVLLFELFAGTRPFEGQTVDEIFDRILHEPLDLAPLDQAPGTLRDLIAHCTAKDPAARPQEFAGIGALLAAMLV